MDESRRDARSRDNEGSDDAAWAAIVASFHASPSGHPWPDAEDLPLPPADNDSPDPRRAGAPESDNDDSTAAGRPAGPTATGDTRSIFSGDGTSTVPWRQHIPAEEPDEHFVAPEPPPLPPTDAITRIAWVGAFGGPAYLLLSTMLGWHVAGWAAVLAVVAFVGGFFLLVLGMSDGNGSDDNGAVV